MVSSFYRLAALGATINLIFIGGVAASRACAQSVPAQQFKLNDEDNWQQSASTSPDSPQGQLLAMRQTLARGEYDRTIDLADAWIERNERDPLLAQAYLIRADAKLANEDEYEALFDYEYIARMFTGSDIFVTALERELDIAKMYAAGRLRKLWIFRIISAEGEAEELFIRIQERMPGSRLAEDAGMNLADFYFDRQQMSLAADAYELFTENYPHSEQLPKARRRLIYAELASFKGPEFDPAGLYEARTRLRDLKRYQPVEAEQIGADGLITRIDESDAAKMLETARWYWRVDNPIAAELTIRRLVKRYQHSVATAEALRLVTDILPHLPAGVREQAPNYAAIRAGLGLDQSKAGAATQPNSTAAPTASEPEAAK